MRRLQHKLKRMNLNLQPLRRCALPTWAQLVALLNEARRIASSASPGPPTPEILFLAMLSIVLNLSAPNPTPQPQAAQTSALQFQAPLPPVPRPPAASTRQTKGECQ